MERKIYKLPSVVNSGLSALVFVLLSGAAFAQVTHTFNFTGSTQTISLPAGNYSIECWGANGGDATNSTAPMSGGKGGYSSGIFTNPSTAVFNVYVGGKGGNTSAANTGGGGGGMSDVAPASNTAIILIAAGGGGGATSGSSSEASTGGDGGGLTGGTAIDGTGVSTGTAASGGSQTAGGIALAGSYGAGTPGGYGYGGGAANGGLDGAMHGAGGAGGNGGVGGWNGGGGGCTTTGGNDHAAGGGAGYYGGGGGRGDGGAGGGGSSYIGGVTSAVTYSMGETGFVANPDLSGNGLVLIKEMCSITLSVTGVDLNGALCGGNSVTLTTNAVSNYSWSTGATTSSLVLTPASSTVYALTATSPSNCTSSAQVSITVNPLPSLNLSANVPVVCLGESAVLTVSGADSYSWSTNATVSTLTVTPAQMTTYSVTGTNTLTSCSSSETVTIEVVTPSVSITGNNTICKGSTATLSASGDGAVSYTWSTGLANQTIIDAPTSHTIYVVTAKISTLNTVCMAVNSITVTVNPLPNIIPNPNMLSMCVGEVVTFAVTGGTAYTWTWGSQTLNSPTLAVTPTQVSNLLVNVKGTDANGCSNTGSVAVQVYACTGIGEMQLINDAVNVYPNPSQGEVNIVLHPSVSEGSAELLLISEVGQVVRTISLNGENGYKTNVADLSSGIYFITGQIGTQRISKTISVTR